MNKFVILWSLISPGCLSLVASVLWFYQLDWYPAYPDIERSLAVYLTYWLLLGSLQGAILFWKFQERQLAYQWFLMTTTVGFAVMLLHDLALFGMGVDSRGQGILILVLSLPVLAILGGLPLGLAQYLLIRKRYRTDLNLKPLTVRWFAISFGSWVIGFVGILFGLSGLFRFVLIFFVATGSFLKGWFIQKYLRK